MLGHAGWDMTTLDWRIWDEFPPKGNLPSIYEKVLIQDYDDVMDRGFSTILFSTELKNGIHERSVDDFLYYQFEHTQVWSKAGAGSTPDRHPHPHRRARRASAGPAAVVPRHQPARHGHVHDPRQAHRVHGVARRLRGHAGLAGGNHHGRRRAARAPRTSSSTTVRRPACRRTSTTSSTSRSPRR